MSSDFIRYLAAKKSVEDRAFNEHVWQALLALMAPGAANRPRRILEIGAGIGAMAERLLAAGRLDGSHYTAIDADDNVVAEARRRLAEAAGGAGAAWQLELETIAVDALIERDAGRRQWDLLIAHAFLDLVDVPQTLPRLLSLLRPGGWLYSPVNFDGATILEPAIEPAFDDRIEALYHQTMDERQVGEKLSGDSRTGRRLFGNLRQAGIEIVAAGSSDWVVFAGPDGYPADEAFFLRFIIGTIEAALSTRPQIAREPFREWIARRMAQIESGELVYIAHQLDFLGRKPGPN